MEQLAHVCQALCAQLNLLDQMPNLGEWYSKLSSIDTAEMPHSQHPEMLLLTSFLQWNPHWCILKKERAVTYPTITVVLQDIVRVDPTTCHASPLSELQLTWALNCQGSKAVLWSLHLSCPGIGAWGSIGCMWVPDRHCYAEKIPCLCAWSVWAPVVGSTLTTSWKHSFIE